MVLESLITPSRLFNKKYLFLIGVCYATLAVFLSYWIFPGQASIVMVLFVVLAAVPLFFSAITAEETKIKKFLKERDILYSHSRILSFFLFFFIGLTITFTFWHTVLPESMANEIFKLQAQTITELNHDITGNVVKLGILGHIFFNNVKVLILSVFFSFLFGSGAIFILSWNASVIATAASKFFSNILAKSSASMVPAIGYATLLSTLRYAIHGIPEIAGYIIAGIAGGILSAAIIRKDLTKNFDTIVTDVSDLLIIGVAFLFVAGLLEVFVTPLFF